ncbi:Hypothetical Protein FCC1311_044952 [Hondaea fermentalgiana]|uniref:Uncharacterized protein n=1 Tax=Hondaea fermentalgiana TaxID=2315210 RepID=A0A2R5GBA0_9STRA|nr:Hypothetical Protein FCC1311_044952 [Hondaea fermentalgiana]|eukprot:GBG28272.1 Hypothetical Protein FCC1311_044952 [Hondaea fermentalgiana]
MKDLKFFIRRASAHDPQMARDIRAQVQEEFRKYQQEKDKALQSVLLKNGGNQLEQLTELVTMRSGARAPAAAQGWKGTVDPDGSDERGRVGEGWPWESKK